MSLETSSERGSALIGVLLLLMVLTALTGAFAVSGHTETLVVRNHQTRAQARAAAEAGLNHAVQPVIQWLAKWPTSYATPDAAVDALLANPSMVGFAFGTALEIAGAAEYVEYEVTLMDEDDPDRLDAQTTLEDDDDPSNDEDGSETTDNNRKVVIRAVGRGPNNAVATVEGIVTPVKLPAIITDGDLTVSGSVNIVASDNGGVHSNANLTMSGVSVITGIDSETGLPDLSNGTATASGTYSAGITSVATGVTGGGKAQKPMPNVRASFYRSWADYVLESTGQATCNKSVGCSFTTYTGLLDLIGTTETFAEGATICDASNNPNNQCRQRFGWVYDTADDSWTLNLNNPDFGDGSFYVEGQANISGSPGSALDPLNVTVFAEGSINVSGAPNLTPDSTEILFVTDGDLQITGNMNMPLAEGQMLIHEQVRINASAVVLLGQVVAENAESDDPLVTSNSVQGLTITYTGDVGNTLFRVSGWREVR